MKKLILSLLVAVGLIGSASAQDADNQLNTVYKQLMSQLDPAGKKDLKEDEKQWIKNRDAIVAASSGDKSQVLEQETLKRVQQLQDRLGRPKPSNTQTTETTALTVNTKETDINLPPTLTRGELIMSEDKDSGDVNSGSPTDFQALNVTFRDSMDTNTYIQYTIQTYPKQYSVIQMSPEAGRGGVDHSKDSSSKDLRVPAPELRMINIFHKNPKYSYNPKSGGGLNDYLGTTPNVAFENTYWINLRPLSGDHFTKIPFDILNTIYKNFDKFEEWCNTAHEKNPPNFKKPLPTGEGDFLWKDNIAYLLPYPKGFNHDDKPELIQGYSEGDILDLMRAYYFYPSAKKQIQEAIKKNSEAQNKASQSIDNNFK